MQLHTMMRLISILIVAAIARYIPNDRAYNSLIFSLGFAHYALSVIYARRQISAIAAQPAALFASLGLAALAMGLYFGKFSLVIYFAIHHVFNEVYLLNREVRIKDADIATGLRNSSIFLNFLIYLVVLRHENELRFLTHYKAYVFGTLAISCAVFFYFVFRARKSLAAADLVSICAFEILGLGLATLSSHQHPVRFLDVVLYHFVFWALYPLPKMMKRGYGEMGKYVGLNALLSAGFILFSPVAFLPIHVAMPLWFTLFMVFSYLHITMSFALSTAHPAWITKWVQPPALRSV